MGIERGEAAFFANDAECAPHRAWNNPAESAHNKDGFEPNTHCKKFGVVMRCVMHYSGQS